MASPFPKSASAAGEGRLVAQVLPNGISGLTTVTYQYPLKLISPSPALHHRSVLAFLLTYGGGLVGGDQVHLNILVKAKAKLSIVTQGHTKIFKSPSSEVITRQRLDVIIEPDAALCLLPDPVQPFEGSVYQQSQTFTLSDTSSVCVLDWVSQGRTARGEDWSLTSWRGRNEIWLQGTSKLRLVLRDSLILDESMFAQKTSLKGSMHSNGLFGTLILKGHLVERLAAFFMQEFAELPRIGARDFRSDEDKRNDAKEAASSLVTWRTDRRLQEKRDCVLWSAAKVRGCTVVKFGATTVEGARHWVGNMIAWEGSIQENFGDDACMCIRP